MMNNLFSIFDPATALLIPFNWLSMFLFLILFPHSYWLLFSPHKNFFKSIMNSMMKEFLPLLKNKKMNMVMCLSLFFLILFNNTMGLFSFTFTSTSHLSITLSLALPLWLGFIMFSLMNNLEMFLAHLIPMSTPPILMPFMVIIELISNLIRPMTLSVRLAANMTAGHLLLTLLGNQVVNSMWSMFIPLMFTQILLMILEFAVACIQAYVFSVLTTLYASEA